MAVPSRRIRVYRERRSATANGQWEERRVYCWTIGQCDEASRATCHAHIVRENCWDFWITRGAKYKACCQKLDNCLDCPIAQQKFSGDLAVYVRVPEPVADHTAQTSPAARGNCQHLEAARAMPQGQALRRLLREREPEDVDVFRCRRRGVHLDGSYVADICANAARDCVFLP